MLLFEILALTPAIFVFWFCIVYLPKKMETDKWPKAADSPLLVIVSMCFVYTKIYIKSI